MRPIEHRAEAGVRERIARIFRFITWRRLGAVTLDVIILVLAYYLMLAFRYQGDIPENQGLFSYNLSVFLAMAVVLHVGMNAVFHAYSIVSRYVGLPQAKSIVASAMISVTVLLVVDIFWPTGNGRLLPLSVVLVGGATAGVAMTVVRFYSRIFQARSLKPVYGATRTLVVGAGQAAEMLVRQIEQTPSLGVKIVGLLDDAPRYRGMRIHGHPVLGPISNAANLAQRHDIDEFVIAIPSADSAQMQDIYSHLRATGLPINTLPPLSQVISDQVSTADVRELRVEDLLGRDPVEIDLTAVGDYVKGRRVLVTGAAGSIGSELCRQLSAFGPESLILIDHDESSLYALHEDLRTRGFDRHEVLTTSIRQPIKMRMIFEEHRPHVVFHAAAFKHVPLMEHCPDEAVLNNVMGTQIVVDAAAAVGAERFVNISTDKAVDPTSVMGATKRVAEMVVRAARPHSPDCVFCSVRFGNVLASQGSVIPIFERQIEQGGPVTVTHPDMTRFFMSIPEAVTLVLQAAALSAATEVGPGVFILEMGEPVRIVDLASKVIDIKSKSDGPAIEIEYIGLRPGEKLYEVLVGSSESVRPTTHPMVKVLQAAAPEPSASDTGTADLPSSTDDLPSDFDKRLAELVSLAEQHSDRETMLKALQALLPTYKPFAYEKASWFPGGEGLIQRRPWGDARTSVE